jgi:Holliday junction resolvasome RuvABC endonuclease subunit
MGNPCSLILGVDPGFARTGYAVVALESAEKEQVLEMGVIRTDKATGLVRSADDNVRRARELATRFFELTGKYVWNGEVTPIRAICAESMSYPRNSSAAAKMAMCWGVLSAVSYKNDIPIVCADPQGLKRKLVGKRNASKDEVEDAVKRRYGNLDSVVAAVIPSWRNHAYDALAAVMACLDSEVIRIARKMTS